jgi:citrate lyase subunit beta/citryl-CoA lyase
MEREWRLPLCRSYLYVPATRPELFPKAIASEADAVIVDLEDGVSVDRKQHVHQDLIDLLATPQVKPVYVRTNALQSRFAALDLETVATLPIVGVRIPKVRCARDVAEGCELLRKLEFGGGLQLQIESAEGVLRLREIAQADPMVEFLSIGEGDLSVELACEKSQMGSVRWEVVVVSRAFGLQRPIQGGHRELAATSHFEQSTREGKQAGFFGRIAIHPAQIPVINRVYTPCRHEVAYARDALERLEAVICSGQTTTRDMHGEYLSVWYRARGERILREHERFGALDDCPACRSNESVRVIGAFESPVKSRSG